MERQFAELGVVGERLDAVTIEQVPSSLLAYHAGPAPLRWCSPAALACSLSHAKAWSHMLAQGYESAIIMEDDALLNRLLLPFTALGLIQSMGADILKLETNRRNVVLGTRTIKLNGVMMRELLTTHLGCAAYVISRAAAEASLASARLHKVPLDHFLFSMRGMHLLRSSVWQATPSPAIQLSNAKSESSLARSDIAVKSATDRRARASRPRAGFPNLLLNRIRLASRLISRDPLAAFRKSAPVRYASELPK